MVETCSQNLRPLRVEDSLRNFPLVPLENGSAGKGGDAVDSRSGIDAGSDETGSDSVKVKVQNLVGVPLQN